MDALTVTRAQPGDPGVRAILQTHHDLMRASSPEESCHALDVDSLLEAGATLLVARDGEEVLGVGALAPLCDGEGELKSMHTTQAARRRGVASLILDALVAEARDTGLTRLNLETGSADMFAPARALYARAGFTECPPFGSYNADPLSVFMTREV